MSRHRDTLDFNSWSEVWKTHISEFCEEIFMNFFSRYSYLAHIYISLSVFSRRKHTDRLQSASQLLTSKYKRLERRYTRACTFRQSCNSLSRYTYNNPRIWILSKRVTPTWCKAFLSFLAATAILLLFRPLPTCARRAPFFFHVEEAPSSRRWRLVDNYVISRTATHPTAIVVSPPVT